MVMKKKSACSSRVKSKGGKSATVAGHDGVLRTNDIVAEQASASDDFVTAMPYSSSKELEYGHDNAVAPPPTGMTAETGSSSLTASTTSEKTETAKTGGAAQLGANATAASLERVRVDAFATNGHTMEFIKDQFRHCKMILALGAGRELLEMAGIGSAIDEDQGILLADSAKAAGIVSAFIEAIAAHRHFSRDSDPPTK